MAEDREIAVFRDAEFNAVERMEAVDPLTFTVYWEEPYIYAGDLVNCVGLGGQIVVRLSA